MRNNVTPFPIETGIPRALEAAIALVGLIVCAPLLVLCGVAVAMTSRGPVFFRQERIGRGGRRFILYKLRTMRGSITKSALTAGGDPRVTRAGKFLRRYKLDELPQLWNVVKGDMSLVGPRPEVPRYVSIDSPLWRHVLRVRPGLTDPVSLRLRNEESVLAGVTGDYERFYIEALQPFKLKRNIAYLHRRTWRSDVRVLCQTVIAIIFPLSVATPSLQEITAASSDRAAPTEYSDLEQEADAGRTLSSRVR